MTIPLGPLFDPSQFGGIALTGWVGENPEDGRDYPFLLLYTTGGGDLGPDAAPGTMTAVLAAQGLRVGELLRGPDQVATTTARIVVTDAAVELRMGDDQELVASTHIGDEWASVARTRREALLTACVHPAPRVLTDLAQVDALMHDPKTLRSSAYAFLPINWE
jgi:hypothetical protein